MDPREDVKSAKIRARNLAHIFYLIFSEQAAKHMKDS